jgi:hypothetical protein
VYFEKECFFGDSCIAFSLRVSSCLRQKTSAINPDGTSGNPIEGIPNF